jgi:trimeric autotransporter adhesin
MKYSTLLRGISCATLSAALSFGIITTAHADATPECNAGAAGGVIVSSLECGYLSTTGNTSGSTAIGAGARVSDDGGTAVGNTTNVSGSGSGSPVTIAGFGVFAPGNVALGQFSSDGGVNTDPVVSVGNSDIGLRRRIINVADGFYAHDAATVGQLDTIATAIIRDYRAADLALSAVDDALSLRITGAQQSADDAALAAAAARLVANNALARTQFIAINSGEGGTNPLATGRNAIAVGSGAIADSDSAVAIGVGAQATGGASVSIGAGNIATGNGAVAIGDPNIATGTGAVAIGENNGASGTGAVALGANSAASGDGSVAIGNNTSAQGSSIALGNGATATAPGSIAIGNNVHASRYNEVAIGNSSSSYVFAGLATGGEGAAPPRFLTVNANGQLAASSVGPADLVNLQGQLASLSNQFSTLNGTVTMLSGRIGALEGRTSVLEQRARQANGGIAAAMALGNAFLPEGKNIAMSFNLATYRGEQGFSGSIVARVNNNVYFSGGFAGSSVKGSTGGRAGVTFGW